MFGLSLDGSRRWSLCVGVGSWSLGVEGNLGVEFRGWVEFGHQRRGLMVGVGVVSRGLSGIGVGNGLKLHIYPFFTHSPLTFSCFPPNNGGIALFSRVLLNSIRKTNIKDRFAYLSIANILHFKVIILQIPLCHRITEEFRQNQQRKTWKLGLIIVVSFVPVERKEDGIDAYYKPELYTKDGTVDRFGRPAIKSKSGGWKSGALVLVNQGLATLAFFGVGVNLVLFLTRVLRKSNAESANDVSKWTGTVYIFSLVGAFLSDSYWGRYRTCAVFQVIFVVGLVLLSVSTHLFLLKPDGCGTIHEQCGEASSMESAIFYLSIYLVALGNGGYQPSIATFGADQYDEEDSVEGESKVAFFSWFYLALNLGSLFSNTILGYFEDIGVWLVGFWASAGAAALALVIFLIGTPSYRHFRPGGNPLPRVAQVFTAAFRKWNVKPPSDGDKLYELQSKESAIAGSRKIMHSQEFRFLDKAATETEQDITSGGPYNPWRVCTVTQVEEVKCILRMLPIWLCTIIYSVVFTQMASLFVEQGAAMKTEVGGFHIPPAGMSMFDILSVAVWIVLYRKVVIACAHKVTGNAKGMTELQRMGVGLVLGMMAMVAAGFVEVRRLKRVTEGMEPLSIFWQIPQYGLIGASEVFMYVGQLEFFNGQAPDGLRSFGSALCMTSISFGNYVSSLLVTIVMDITRRENKPGWIPGNLNRGHMDRFYFLLAALTAIDLGAYIMCARWYTYISVYKNDLPALLDEETHTHTPFDD